MTSQINPATIDGNYPIAGVPNNTQGMRDNFTAIKTNFQFAETEIDDLQSKGVFKAALTGTTLDNNMANNLIYNAKIQGFSGTLIQIANTSGAITVDCSAGHVQTIVMGGNISVSFTTATWPAAGSVGIIRLIITVDQAARTLTLPATVSLGTTGIQGYSANVITFAAAGTYEFGFLTYDQGTSITLFDYNRPLNYYTNAVTIAANTASTSNITGALTVAGGVGIGGNLYVTGDIFGNVSLTDISVATVTATGNIVGGNINAGTGNISTTGNVIGGNVLGGANVNATLFTGTTVSVAGSVTGGNLITAALAQAATLSATGAVTFSGTNTNQNIATSQTTGTLILGGTSQTGAITVGRSTASQEINIHSGATGAGNTKTINIGDGGLAGSTTTIAIGPVTASTAAGTVTFNTATLVAIGNTSGTALSAAGNVTGGNLRTAGAVVAATGQAITAGGTTAGLEFSSTLDFGVFFGSGVPTISAAKGSLYLRSDGTTTNDRMYVNTNGSTTWTAVITAA